MPGRLCSREQSSKWWFVKSCFEGLLEKFWPLTSETGKNWNGEGQPMSSYEHTCRRSKSCWTVAMPWQKAIYECCSVVLLNAFAQLCLLITICFTCKKPLMWALWTYRTFTLMICTDLVLSQAVFKLERIVAMNYCTTVVWLAVIRLSPSVTES